MFKVLILGNPNSTFLYLARAFNDVGENKEAYNEWYREINVLDNICDLEIDVITNLVSIDLDNFINLVDGIIYFLNPLDIDEFEFFEMTLPIINSVKRGIPTIIIFYDPESGILPISTNTLLDAVWLNFPNLEAFVNLPPSDFHQALQCLCLAMILGDTPLNIENAWMRFPIFIKLANDYYKQQQYYYAAQAIRMASKISEIYNKENFFIYCEQAAYLFSKSNLYLEASQILKRVDKRKSNNFKKLYAEAMVREANKLFNTRKFEMAARQYEMAGQWSSIELKDKTIIQEAFRLAINSWISACKCNNAFRILERLPHKEKIKVLNDITDKIVAAADYLLSINDLNSARDQLYRSINTYQREGLFENIKKFSLKLTDVLIKIFEQQTNNREIYSAKNTFDEIENMWETFKVKRKNIDSLLEKLIRFFIEEHNFGMSSYLINKLNSLELKKELTELSSDIEDKIKESKKKEIEKNIQEGLTILNEFIEKEREIIIEQNYLRIYEAKKFIERHEYLKGANVLKDHANYLKNLGKTEIAEQILTKSLDFLIDGSAFEIFIKFYSLLQSEIKTRYLKRIFPILFGKLKELSEKEDFKRNEFIFESLNRIYRNQMLYEESKQISEQFIKIIKKEALKIVNSEENLGGIKKTSELVKKINDISSSYLESTKITFNKLYKKIAEIYISFGDLLNAQAYNDRIENKAFKTELHKKIAKIEASKSALKTKQAEDALKGEILKEKLSIIKKKGRDVFQDRENELKQRRAFKRAYFKEALLFVKNNKFNEAIQKYKESIVKLNKIKKYNLAGVSLAITGLLLIKENKINELIKLIDKVKKELARSEKLFSETYPVILIEYIIAMKKLMDENKLKEALSFLENLPLFEEEISLLYDYLGKKKPIIEKIEKSVIGPGEIASYRSKINKLAKDITKEKSEIAKRKMMKRQIWQRALNALAGDNLSEAAIYYLDAVPKMIDKNFLKHAAIGLILGSLLLIREKDIHVAKETFEEYAKKMYHKRKEMEDLPEIKILKTLFFSYENNIASLIKLNIEYFIDKLILFEEEIAFLKSLLGDKVTEVKKKETITRKERGALNKLLVELDQTLGILEHQMRDIKSDINDFFTKRKAMRRRYYDPIIILLKNASYKEVSSKYFDLARTLSKRKAYKTSALVLLLGGLSLLKLNESPSEIKVKIKKILDSFGLSKKLILETFYTSLLFFLLDVKLNKLDKFIPKIKNMLKILPLFDEEKVLAEI
ncbi:MAG: hypothetical protein ACTSQJ_13180 [Promethearchaeota archaeon]